MGTVRNVLFVMCDQLRADHISAYGARDIATPNIDALAARGVRFTRAYCQSAVCGPSRMSFYTGRYSSSHGATWNSVPMSIREQTLGQLLEPDIRVTLCGKTHAVPDKEGMARLGIAEGSSAAARFANAGFEDFDRHEGHVAPPPESPYNRYLRAKGYDAPNPWEAYANSALDETGEIVSGWWLRNAHLAARVRAEDSETAYMTDRAIAFMSEQGERPFLLHLSYIKPHWPYLAPAPYHAMFRDAAPAPLNRGQAERERAHPALAAYAVHDECQSFMHEEIARHVRPAYLGLVKEIDDNIGRLMSFLDRSGRAQDTLVVFTSDHGDFLGDHWLGEKEIMYEEAARIPLIIADPSPEAAATRGHADDRLVEAIDVAPTLFEALGRTVPWHLFEGRSLLPVLRGNAPATWREAAICELDYSFRQARRVLGFDPSACRAWMVRTDRHKLIAWQDLPLQLFDLTDDPSEQNDLGSDPERESVRRDLLELLFDWTLHLKPRVTASGSYIEERTNNHRSRGIHIGIW